MRDLITYIAQTTYLDFDEATHAVQSGLMLGWTLDEMRPYGGDLPLVIECAAAGYSKAQIAGWRDKLPYLLLAWRSLHVNPRDVPTAP